MAVTLTGSGGLFTRLGKALHALNTLNTHRLTTVPAEIQDYTDEFDDETPAILRAIENMPRAEASLKSAWDSVAAEIRTSAQQVLIQMVKDDNPQSTGNLREALEELLRQMDGSATVDASAVGISVTPGGSNVGNGVWVTSTKRADGRNAEYILGEDLFANVISDATPGQEVIQIRGEAAETNRLSQDWPAGSGAVVSTTAVEASTNGNLLTNGGFEAETERADSPDGWELPVATIGTTVEFTDVEVQTLTIASDPTSGWYTVTDPDTGQTTVPLAWNASANDLQTALRALKGNELVTVTSTGVSPNFTHTITYVGRGGNLSQITATSGLDTGTITPGTTSGGDAEVFRGGHSLKITGDGAELTLMQQQVAAEALTQYAFNSFWRRDGSAAGAGVFKIGLWDGSDWIDDEAGTENSFTIDLTSLTTSFVSYSGSFRLPADLPDVVYLRGVLTTALTDTRAVFTDQWALSLHEELYQGGPSVKFFAADVDVVAGDGVTEGDVWTITPTNDRGGEFQEGFNRLFGLQDLDLQVPSNAAGGESINDNLIA